MNTDDILIDERAVLFGKYIAENGATVRSTAKFFGCSKSTVHKDVSERLRTISPSLFGEVRQVLEKNKAERHLRGGMATKMKYEISHKLKEEGKCIQ